jgi:hypothetical protein
MGCTGDGPTALDGPSSDAVGDTGMSGVWGGILRVGLP